MFKKIEEILVIFFSIIGSTLVASNIGYAKTGFLLFGFGSLITLKMILKSNADRSLVVVTLYFLIMDILGFFRN